MVAKLEIILVEKGSGILVEGVRPCLRGIDNISWKGTRGAQWRALDLILRRVLQVVSEPVPSRKCANEDVGPLRGVDCDDLSGRVRGTSSYLMSNLTSPGW